MAYIRTAFSQNGTLVGHVTRVATSARMVQTFDGANQAVTLDFATTGVTGGTYTSLTVDAYGRVTAATNPGFITGNQTITLSGDASGSGSTAITVTLANSGATAGTYSAVAVNAKGLVTSGINMTFTGDATGTAAGASAALTLANSGVTAGTYNNLTVNAKGLVTAATTVAYLTGNQSITLSGDASGAGTTSIAVTLANSGATAGTYSAAVVNAKGLVTSGANLTATGDATGTAAGASIALTLANTGTAGTYMRVVTDAKGRVTSGSGWQRAAVAASTYTVAAADTYIGVTFTTTGAVTITFPAAQSFEGRQLIIKDEGGNAFVNNITLSSTETIDGATTAVLNVNLESLMLVYSNSRWWIV